MVRLWRSVRGTSVLAYVLARGVASLCLRRPQSRTERAEWFHRYCSWTAKTLGVRISTEGDFPDCGAVISNHIGYLDIVAFAAAHPCVFVSKAELRRWPVMGWISWMVGTVYVQRGRGGSAERAGEPLRAAAEENVPVVFFPEGTNTDGTQILPFHSGVLAKVLEEGKPVTAAYIRYALTEDNGPDVSIERDLCWGEVPFFWHVFKALGLRGIEVSVRFASAPIPFSVGAGQRKRAAEEARSAVLALSPAQLPITAD